jgi:DNA polymerase epsilon subunit 1
LHPSSDCLREDKFYKGHLLESETYVGGHVESLVSGVFRSDLPIRFDISPEKVDSLILEVGDIIQFFVETEGGTSLENIVNFEETKAEIIEKLEELRKTPHRVERPLLYHVDVASMYPNIILTNRLQPTAIVSDAICAACIHNRPGKSQLLSNIIHWLRKQL